MIVYLSKEELAAFVAAEADSMVGYAYEWENEGVVHLHTRPLTHAFGLVTRCFFTKGRMPELVEGTTPTGSTGNTKIKTHV